MRRRVLGFFCFLAIAATPMESRAATLYAENFDDGTAHSFVPRSGTWDVPSGTYHSRVDGFEVSAISEVSISTLDYDWVNYRVELDMRADGSVNHVVLFRIQDADNYYQWNVRADPYNDAVLEKIVHGQHNVLSSVAFVNTPGAWHRLGVEVTGHSITGMCDGQTLLSGVDTVEPYLQGHVGVMAFAGGVIQFQDLYVDNLVVTTAQPVSLRTTSWGSLKSHF